MEIEHENSHKFDVRGHLERLRRTILPVYRRQIRDCLPSPTFRRLAAYLIREWESAVPIRGFLTVTGYRIGGQTGGDATDVAVAVELAQLASLVVDDVIDRSEIRDGASGYKRFGPNVCILAGEILKGCASCMLARFLRTNPALANGVALVERFEVTYREVCVGQLIDIWHEGHDHLTERQYLSMIDRTTGGFLEGAIDLGAALGNVTECVSKVLRQYARCLGMGLQIYDDALDVLPHNTRYKPFAHDLRRRKQRLPLIRYLEVCSQKERAAVIRMLRKTELSTSDIHKLSRAIVESGALRYAIHRGKEFSDRGREAALRLPDDNNRRALLELIEFLQPENDDFLRKSSREILLRCL